MVWPCGATDNSGSAARNESDIHSENMEWLRKLRKELGSQCHGRRFRVWRWEEAEAQCVGTEWSNVAQDRLGWRAKMDAMIKWREQKMMDRNTSPIE